MPLLLAMLLGVGGVASAQTQEDRIPANQPARRRIYPTLVTAPQGLLVRASPWEINTDGERAGLTRLLAGMAEIKGHLGQSNEFVLQALPGVSFESIEAKIHTLYTEAIVRVIASERIQVMHETEMRGGISPHQ